jgi:hypothetical protein
VLAILRRERNQYLLSAFGIFDETRSYLTAPWAIMDPGYVVFMYNALRYLAGSSTVGQQPSVTPGQPFTVAAKPGTRSVDVKRADGRSENAPVGANGLASYGGTDHVGIYRIATGIPGQDARAVNLLDEQESFITPNLNFRIAAGDVQTARTIDEVNRPLWPWLLGAMALVLLLEWIVYNKRVFV